MVISMPKVWNKRDPKCPKDAIYVGRPTKWGNLFSHLPNTTAKFRVNTRAEAVAAFRNYVVTRPDLIEAAQKELKSKDLVCWCAPAECHAEVWMEIANDPNWLTRQQIVSDRLHGD